MRSFLLLAVLSIAAVAAPAARAAESYQSCTGVISSLPTVLSTQGTWCLQADLATAIGSGNAIQVNTNNVTIDCNGFKLGGLGAGNTSTTRGVYAYNKTSITVRGCNIRGFNQGVFLEGYNGSGHIVEDNRFDGNLSVGINVQGDGSVVRRNQVMDTGGLVNSTSSVGISGWGADVTDNVVVGVFATDAVQRYPVGISADGQGVTVARNSVRGLVTPVGAAYGIRATGPSAVIRENTVANYPSDSGNASQRGISAGGPGDYSGFCINNVVAGFTTPFGYCVSTEGNQSK